MPTTRGWGESWWRPAKLATALVLWTAAAAAQPLGIELISVTYPESGVRLADPGAFPPLTPPAQPGDVLLFVNGVRTTDLAAAATALRAGCGTTMQVVLFRTTTDGTRHRIPATATPAPSAAACQGTGLADTVVAYPVLEVTGFVERSAARTAGLQVGDRIMYVNGQRVFGNRIVFERIVHETPEGNPVSLNIYSTRLQSALDLSVHPAPAPTPAAPLDEGQVLRGAVMAVQAVLLASGLEHQPQSGVWDAVTADALGRFLMALQRDELWALGWEGGVDGIYSPAFAAHLRLTAEVLNELEIETDGVALMNPFLDAMDLLVTEGVYLPGGAHHAR